MSSHKIKVWVEALGEVVKGTIEVDMTKDEWFALTENQRNAFVETWAYDEVQMGYGYEDDEDDDLTGEGEEID